MNRLIKTLFYAFLITIIFFVTALVAAPFFVRQEQVQSFIESKVVLPDNQKLKLEGKIQFGIFPYMNINVPAASIIDKNGNVTSFKNFSFGFNIIDILGKSISFDSAFEYEGNEYDGSFYIEDYQGFLNNSQSPITFSLEKPLPVKVEGNLSHQGSVYLLKDFVVTHKATTATGSLKLTSGKDKSMQIDLNTEIQSANIEDIRKLVEFNKADDFDQLSGNGKVALNVTTNGIKANDFKSNLNGSGNFTINDAAIYGIDLNELISAPQKTRLTKNSNIKIDIKKADSTFKINNGIVKIDELTANAKFANITGSGTIDIPANKLDVSVDINANLGAAKAVVPLYIYGSFDKIKFAPRLGDAILGNIDNLKDISKIKLKDIKINLKNGNMNDSVDQLRGIGKSFGIDLDKITKGKTKGLGTQPVAEPASPQEPAAPAETPASQQNIQ